MWKKIKKLGPGLLFAGAAIGVSHLVQSTRAGADYGWGLTWALLLVNLWVGLDVSVARDLGPPRVPGHLVERRHRRVVADAGRHLERGVGDGIRHLGQRRSDEEHERQRRGAHARSLGDGIGRYGTGDPSESGLEAPRPGRATAPPG